MKLSDKGKRPPHLKRKSALGGERLMVRKWGNSAGIRIPAAMMKAAKLKLDDEVEARVEEGKIIVQCTEKRKYTLKELLKGVTPENSHDSFETMRPVGKEVW